MHNINEILYYCLIIIISFHDRHKGTSDKRFLRCTV